MKQKHNYFSKLLIILLVLTSTYSFSQEFYFTELGEATKNKKKAKTIITLNKTKNKILLNAFLMIDENTATKIGYKKAKIQDESTLLITVKRANKVPFKMKRTFKKLDSKTYLVRDYDSHGNPIYAGTASSYFPLVKNGWSTTFYKNGQVASTGIYNNNKLLMNDNWTLAGEKVNSNAHSITTAVPNIKSSSDNYIDALGKKIQKSITKHYNNLIDDELNLHRRHSLHVNFIVDTSGDVEVTSVLGNFPKDFKSDVASVLNNTSGKWNPGYIKNKAVNTKLTLPLKVIARDNYRPGASDHVNHWFFVTDIPVRLYRW